jgi:hypothetical protein
MLRTGIFLLTFLLNSVFPLNVNAATKAIRLGRLWDGQRVIANATVIVENDRIQRINTGTKSRRMRRSSISADIPAFPA